MANKTDQTKPSSKQIPKHPTIFKQCFYGVLLAYAKLSLVLQLWEEQLFSNTKEHQPSL